MFKESLESFGLTHDEAEVYEILLLDGRLGAGEILKKTDIKRGLLYKTLYRLKDKKLVTESEKNGRAQFSATSPDELLRIVEAAEADAARMKKSVSDLLPHMKAKYNLANERPTFRFYEGADGLRELYEEQISPTAAKELRFIRPLQASVYENAFGKWFGYYLSKRGEMGIKTHAITPDDPVANHDPEKDEARGVTRTWIRPEDYTSHVEINTHGDMTEIISYGKEIFAFAIDDAYIAKAMKDLFVLAERGAKTIEVKHDHPASAEHS
jgi:sugar-specific transcriptional regulator TrmB